MREASVCAWHSEDMMNTKHLLEYRSIFAVRYSQKRTLSLLLCLPRCSAQVATTFHQEPFDLLSSASNFELQARAREISTHLLRSSTTYCTQPLDFSTVVDILREENSKQVLKDSIIDEYLCWRSFFLLMRKAGGLWWTTVASVPMHASAQLPVASVRFELKRMHRKTLFAWHQRHD